MGYFSRALDNLPKACDDIGVSEKRLGEDVETVKEWLRQQPHLPNVEKGLLVENMLLRNKGSVELAKQTLEFFFTSRSTYPELFLNQDPCSPDAEESQELRKVVLLQDLTSTGHRVVIADLPPPGSKLGQLHMRATLKQWIMHSDLIVEEDIACGVIYILDARNMNINNSTVLLQEFPLFQKTIRCIFSGYKCRVKNIHIFQPPSTIDSILRLIKKVLPQKIAGRMQLHQDLASLHQHVQKAILPKDFGGEKKTFLELADEWRNEEISHRQWFADRQQMWKTDESKRPPGSQVSGKEDDAFGISGSFKKLEFD